MALDPKSPPSWRLSDFTDDSHQEYQLMDSFMCEKVDIGGWDVEVWLHKVTDTEDYLYGEDPNEDWDGPYRTKMLYEPTEEPTLIDAFGFASEDAIQYAQLPKTIWERDIEDILTRVRQPQPKDLVKTLWNNKIYEVVDVGSEEHIFQGKKLVWSLILRPWRYSNQSDAADEILFEDPNPDDFPYENLTVETFSPSAYSTVGTSATSATTVSGYTAGTIPTSALGDNVNIENESNLIWDDTEKTQVYGYDIDGEGIDIL